MIKFFYFISRPGGYKSGQRFDKLNQNVYTDVTFHLTYRLFVIFRRNLWGNNSVTSRKRSGIEKSHGYLEFFI